MFGPAAAHLCNGVDLLDLGDEIDVDLLMPGVVPLAADRTTDLVIAQVLWIDTFGNAQLNVGPDDIPASFGEHVAMRTSDPTDLSGGTTRSARLVESFAAIGTGAIGLVVDSSGLYAIAMDRRSAAEELGLDVGDQVTLTADESGGPGSVTQRVTLRGR